MKRLVRRPRKRKKRRQQAKRLDPTKLKSWSLSVRGRDSFTCISCKSSLNTHAHHMVSKYYRPQFAYAVDNGITLCKCCHLSRGGVHDRQSTPKNNLIKQLRLIFRSNDIRSSLSFGQKLSQKTINTSKLVRRRRLKVGLRKKLRHRYLSRRP